MGRDHSDRAGNRAQSAGTLNRHAAAVALADQERTGRLAPGPVAGAASRPAGRASGQSCPTRRFTWARSTCSPLAGSCGSCSGWPSGCFLATPPDRLAALPTWLVGIRAAELRAGAASGGRGLVAQLRRSALAARAIGASTACGGWADRRPAVAQSTEHRQLMPRLSIWLIRSSLLALLADTMIGAWRLAFGVWRASR